MRPFIISARRHLRAAETPQNLKNALIGEDVRGPCRVQGLILLRFFAYGIKKTAFFNSHFLNNHSQTENIL
jgi:hypothetical protein